MAPSLKKRAAHKRIHVFDSQVSTQMRSNPCLCRTFCGDEAIQSKISVVSLFVSAVYRKHCPTGSLKGQSVEPVSTSDRKIAGF